MIEYTTETGGKPRYLQQLTARLFGTGGKIYFSIQQKRCVTRIGKAEIVFRYPKGTRIKVYDIMRNFYGLWVETYYEGRYYSIDPRCLEYKKECKET